MGVCQRPIMTMKPMSKKVSDERKRGVVDGLG